MSAVHVGGQKNKKLRCADGDDTTCFFRMDWAGARGDWGLAIYDVYCVFRLRDFERRMKNVFRGIEFSVGNRILME